MNIIRKIAAPVVATAALAASFVAAPATASADANCPYLYLCIWDGFNYNGEKKQFIRCGWENIGAMGWSDRIKSFKNNQSPGATTVFNNWNATTGRWEVLDRSRAPEFIPVVNFPIRTTDGIHVC
ncbi:peptidase inhibitor family I36 protein [Amycolatopsis sp.]|uniref:peptidase inhibitor family I36 protein n=1 Tax=Amycolatopsis sp. TaxID=37632 RepID=UPI002D7E3A80|nr:peptidase inhibitor family I36 protein [Amycolatopsis sp.]HET6708114.1 peptidase inhibitor family I36 protein [Amycolatopsis sp.]